MCFFVGSYTELFPPPPGACVCTGQAQYTSDCTEVVPALAHRKYVSITVLKKNEECQRLYGWAAQERMAQPPLLEKKQIRSGGVTEAFEPSFLSV